MSYKTCETLNNLRMKTYPLLEAQIGIVTEWMKGPSVTQYNLPCSLMLPKKISLDKLENVLNKIVNIRKELRTCFVLEDGEVRQYCNPAMSIPIARHRMTDTQAKQYMEKDFVRPFDLFGKTPLVRFELIETEECNYCLMDIHHSIGDGVTLAPNLTIKDLPAAYEGLALNPHKYGMYEYAEDEKKTFGTEQYEKAKRYYAEKFAGIDFISLSENTESPIGNMVRESAFISQDVVDNWCDMHSTKSNLLFMAAFSLVLSKFARTKDLAYYSVNHGRMDKRLRDVYGMFVKSTPILAKVDHEQRAIDFINGFRGELMSTIRYGIYPFNHFCRDLEQIPKVSFTFQGFTMQEFSELEGEHCLAVQLPKGKINNDLSCIIYLHEGDYEIRIESSDALNSVKKLRQVADAIKICVEHIMENPEVELKHLKVLSEEEELRLIQISKGETLEYDRRETFVDLFLRQVKMCPEALAVADASWSLTYGELNHRSNLLAEKLLAAGVEPDSFVCLLLERTIDFPIAVLGVQKVAAAYTPLDVDYPIERIAYMLEDSCARVLLTTHDVYESKCKETAFECETILFLDDMDYTQEATSINLSKPENLAYMIYTSGSTGKPKGAMLHHKGLRNFIATVCKTFALTPDDRISGHRSFSFDAHIEDFYPILTLGGSFHIMPSSIRKDLNSIRSFLFEHDITGGGYATAMACLLLQEFDDLPVRFITGGGEKMENVYSDHIDIFNVYGPTECTDDTSIYRIPAGVRIENIPIGKSVDNCYSVILDTYGHLLPQGMAGELCIVGPQVGRGYWRLPEKTQEVFVDCPFVEGQRMYHTGDLCHYNEDGDLEFLGRIDHQVKLRGFRIELGEIENQSAKFEGIKSVVAQIKTSATGIQHLCLYYTADTEIDKDALRDYLGCSLAEYMVPSSYMQLDEMPMTPNGKVDRKALPEPVFDACEYIEPEGHIEELIAKAFAEVLGLQLPIGAIDSFFSLGGDSIKSIRLVSLLRQQGVEVTVPQIMKAKTVRKIAKVCKSNSGITTISQEPVVGEVGESAISRWFFDLDMPKAHHYNQSAMFRCTQKLDRKLLQLALNYLVGHHDMLRAVVKDGGLFIPEKDCECYLEELTGDMAQMKELEETAASLQQSFDLEGGTLFKVLLFHAPDDDFLFIVAHHLIIDGVSWRILLNDLNNLLLQASVSKTLQLPAKTHSYRDYCEALKKYHDSWQLKAETSYWNAVQDKLAALPGSEGKDYSRTFAEAKAFMDANDTKALLTAKNEIYNIDINDLLLTAVGRSYHHVTGNTYVSIQMEGHGREDIGQGLYLDRTIGWFTSMFPVVLENLGNNLDEDIIQVKETLHRVPDKGVGYNVLKFINGKVGQGNDKIAMIGFNYLGEMDAESKNSNHGFFTQADDISQGTDFAAENKCGPSLSLDCIVTGGNLQMRLAYDIGVFTENQAEDFLKGIIEQITVITDHLNEIQQPKVTATDLGEYEWTSEEFNSVYSHFMEKGTPIRRIYPLTPMQEGMLLKYQMEPDSLAYRLVTRFSLEILPTEKQLRYAIDHIAAKHEVLRTSVIHKGVSKYRQAIIDRPLGLEMRDVSTEQDPMAAIEQMHHREQERGFDLQEEPLFRIVCIKTGEHSCELMTCIHHSIVDGWSTQLFMGDLLRYLNEIIKGEESPLDQSQEGVYESYIRDLDTKDMDAGLEYWRKLLKGYATKAVIPSYGEIPEEEQAVDDEVSFSLSGKELKALESVCSESQVTINTAIELAWGLLLQKYNRTDDAVFVKVVSGRNNSSVDIEQLVGLFINSVPIRVKTRGDMTVREALMELQGQAAESNAFDFCPLASIQQQSELGMELFQSIMAFENYATNEDKEAGKALETLGFKVTHTKEESYNEISLAAMGGNGADLYICLTFNHKKYRRIEIERVMAAMKNILVEISKSSNAQIQSIALLNKEEQRLILNLSKGEPLCYDRSETFVDIFMRQAKGHPASVAVVDEQGSYTYGELNRLTGALAGYLRGLGVGDKNAKSPFVSIMLGYQKEFLVAAIGVEKAGGAYVPLDYDYPNDRILYMLEDSESAVLITSHEMLEEKIAEGESFTAKNILFIEDFINDKSSHAEEADSICYATPEGTAYMIYTSGSTGKPKGVMISHAAKTNLVQFIAKEWRHTPESRICCHSSFSFDASIEDLYPVLTVGGTLYTVPKEARKDMELLHKFIVDNAITGGCYTTQLGLMLLQRYPDLPVHYLVVGGEKMTANPTCRTRLINTYGPTEFTVDATYFECEPGKQYKNIPIGRPVHNLSAYVVDPQGQLVPQGMAGELCMAGAQMASGYWKREDLTAEKFVDCPFAEGKMYHTGDLVRYNEEGLLEYLGRIDSQVKLRGFRIELGEIEALLAGYHGILMESVQVKEVGGVQHLCAYYSADSDIDPESVRSYLSGHLADYMVPTAYMQLDEIPLTPNGKVNTKALPIPEIKAEEIVLPDTETEQRLYDIAVELLKHNQFGVTTNLISMGLTSLSAMKISFAIGEEFGKLIPTKIILKTPNIRSWSEYLTVQETAVTADRVYERREYYPVTENQRGLYIDWEMNRDTTQYNMPNVHYYGNITPEQLRDAIIKAVNAHPHLKTHFDISQGDLVQLRRDDDAVVVSITSLSEKPTKELLQSRVSPFNLLEGPLYRFEIFGTPDGTYLFTDIHHTIFDGVSSVIFDKSIEFVLKGDELRSEEYTSYDRAIYEQEWMQGEDFTEADSYFRKLTADAEVVSYPYSSVPDSGKFGSAYIKTTVSAREIDSFCHKHGFTPNSFFMTVLAQVLHRVLREDTILFTSINNGRDSVATQEITGMFVKTLPVISAALRKQGSFIQAVTDMQQQFIETISRDLYPYSKVVEHIQTHPEIIFVYQGKLDSLPKEDILLESDTVKMPISMVVYPMDDTYMVGIEYNTSLYSSKDMQTLVDAYKSFAESAPHYPLRISDIKLVSPIEEQVLLQLSKGEELTYNTKETYLDLFLNHVSAQPDQPALVDYKGMLTYSELHREACRTAHYLQKKGIGYGDIVAIMLPRANEFFISVLGIQQVGAAYVPVDMDYAEERRMYMIEDSLAKIVIDSDLIKEITEEKDTTPVNLARPEGIAYMIYTSGSTGKPKGVPVSHAAIRACAAWNILTFKLAPGKNNLHHPSFSFDASTFDLFYPLAAGATVHVLSETLRKDMDAMAQYIKENKITGMTMSTALGMALLNAFDLPIEYIMLGGEKFMPVKRTSACLYNGYGPTEFTVCSSFHLIDQDKDINIPIGRSVPNSWSFICDTTGNLLPQGIPGELCLMGTQMAEGYWKRPKLTAEKFVDCTFMPGYKMYRTGDLAVYNPDGELEFLGRIDNQVKLRGFRIELGEIENQASLFDGMLAIAAEVKTKGNNQQLCLYYTARREIDVEALRAHLSVMLADYMIPDRYIQLDEMPMTPNGKVNRRALPEPKFEKEEIVLPETETERKLYDLAVELLQHDQFGVTSNLISVGMNSLVAMRISAMIHQRMEVDVPTKIILKLPNVRSWAEYLKAPETLSMTEKVYEKQEYYPLSENQKGLYVDWEMHRDTTQYNIPNVRFFYNIRSEQLCEAVIKLVNAHPNMKSYFALKDGDVVQLRQDDMPVNVSVATLSEKPSHEFFQSRVIPFNLFEDPLYRFEVYETSEGVYLFSDIHHIIFDGGSSMLFNRSLDAVLRGEEPTKEEYTAFDHTLFEQEWMQSEEYKKAEEFFHDLVGDAEVASYPLSSVPDSETTGLTSVRIIVKGEEIDSFCRTYGFTQNSYFMTALAQVLHRITREESLLFTSIDSGRSSTAMHKITGMFVKTLPIVSTIADEKKSSFVDAVSKMQSSFMESIENELYPYSKVVSYLQKHPEIMFAYQGGFDILASENSQENIRLELDTVKMPISIDVFPNDNNEYIIAVEYDTSLYNKKDMQTLLECYKVFAESAPLHAENIGDIKLVANGEEQRLILNLSKGEPLCYDRSETFVDIFMRQAKGHPASVAVVDEQGSYTYGELNRLTGALAGYLRGLGVGDKNAKSPFVSIMLGYQKEFLVAAIGVEKAGGAYVPLDYDYPNDRILYMLEDSESAVLITSHEMLEEKIAEGESFTAKNILFIEDFINDKSSHAEEADSICYATPEGTAYMIYTSGSTGKPKGVMISHAAKTNLVQFIAKEWRHTPESRICCHSSFSFDASIEDLYPVLTVGGTLYTVPKEARKDMELLHKFIVDNAITGGCYTTQLGLMLLQRYPDLPVHYLVVGGEKMTANPTCRTRLINTYGPTEFTVDATYFECEPGKQYKNIPIGRPVHNLSAYVVDPQGQLVPQGMAGELCMAGAQMASGYWKREDLTAEKFVDCPFAEGKMYHTGDLVRYNEEGLLEYLGRIDSQVKLRGFRIELGEIEALLAGYHGILMESVQVKEVGGVQHLCAYYSADSDIDPESVRSYLSGHLADYMVPTAYMQLDEIPLTPNGKVNTKALPIPEIKAEEIVLPDTETEQRLYDIAVELLKHNQFGVTTNLISMGLTSLSAIRLVVIIQEKMEVTVPVADLLSNPSIRLIAEYINSGKAKSTKKAEIFTRRSTVSETESHKTAQPKANPLASKKGNPLAAKRNNPFEKK